ncbi:hypothetical protein C5167_050263 [Papaver somniferum]|uniref:Phytocyanin domain-containing protein n=1 Tax=Papaver somniferum TaxID=3469 RepID=A0A4Y7KS29_PAPSO|nr:mavicyanin-like [Papaver somniferum]RZC74779.1 hypothetical protein C5167_050263 [Papaver somniferum]
MDSTMKITTNASFVLFLTLLVFLLQLLLVQSSADFEVGDDKGWVVPDSKNGDKYNQWASKNRFQINDTIRFEYKKDSVLVVTDSEYEKCRSTHPIFFSNNGDTIYKFERSGLFYFISGVAGHCERGQKMIIKVLENETPQPSGNTTDTPSDHSGAVNPIIQISSSYFIVVFISIFLFA